MNEQIRVQFLYEGDNRAWEQIKPVVLDEVEFDTHKNEEITGELSEFYKIYNKLNPLKIEQIRWQWGDIGQGHYIGSWTS